jgi:dTDP-4-dehydrorhamnose reductase
MNELEVWGGVDYSLNRIRDEYLHQGIKLEHHKKVTSPLIFAQMGIKKVRYPCLWELVAPKDLDYCHWTHLDEKLGECQKLGIDPIAHFLHHGSGPQYTSLIDPDFPEKFAIYARTFARRYPWIENYSPISDIFLTARLSCLEETWYPHLNSRLYFLKAIYLQCKATVLAMKAIRSVNPRARLLQMDEIGQTPRPKTQKYRAELAQDYKWTALDFLSGNITEQHPIYGYLKRGGLTDHEIFWFQEHSATPNIIGLNLHQQEHLETAIIETWDRYRIPLALTETEVRGTQQEIHDIWNMAKKLKTRGIDIRAVTAWSQTGSHNAHEHYAKCENYFGPHIFPVRSAVSGLHSS